MIRSNLEGVEFVIANTDAQALAQSPADRRIQMGTNVTQGLGAGSRPEIGRAAAEESLDEILENLSGSHMVFVTAGMGGGTGTGASPVIARAARDQGILTVGVVTKPFQFEGAHRARMADAGVAELQQYVDTLIIIPNQNLFRIANENTTFAEAFTMADEVLHSGVRGITDLMVMPGLINLDFADIRTVMNEMGKAMMGTGEAEGEKRAVEAAEAAISNPLLDEVSMNGAQGVIINITGGPDLKLYEVDEAANHIRSQVDPDANIIVGSTFNEDMEGMMRVSVVATGIDMEELERPVGVGEAPMVAGGQKVAAQPLASSSGLSMAPQQANPVGDALQNLETRVQADLQAPQTIQAPAAPAVAQAPSAQGFGQEISEKPQATLESAPSAQESQPARGPSPSGSEQPGAIQNSQAHISQQAAPPAQPSAPQVDASLPLPPVAASTGSSPTIQRKKPASFFERMTNGVLSKGGATVAKPNPAPAQEHPGTQAPAASTPKANDPNRQEGLFKPNVEEDPLEIPAFLRRQAN